MKDNVSALLTVEAEYTKLYYSIGEVSRMLDLPIYTLRFWEEQFPMFNPHRSAKGTRRYTPADIELAKAIKAAVYDKGMKIDGAVEYLNKTYRRYPPRNPISCKDAADAIAILTEVKSALEDAHQIARIKAVVNWIEAKNRPKSENF